MKKMLLLFAVTALGFGCQKHKIAQVDRAFYYWKSNGYSLGDPEKQLLDTLAVKKLYVKFFEVETHEVMGNIPIDKTSLRAYQIDSLEVVPTVYIRNEVMARSTHKELDLLASNIDFLISKYAKEHFDRAAGFPEYQMDCDWTLKTKENYFYFLKKLKGLSGKKISCTLRLYPYKYPEKMGIPPVDSAMLMCYNLVNPVANKDKNSILDLDELAAYLNPDQKYPMHLDVALPVYSWMLLYQNNQFKALLYDHQREIESILTEKQPLWYEVNKDSTFGDYYLRVGDRIKYEKITPEKLTAAIQLLQKKVAFDDRVTVSLFHLDENQLSQYNHETLERFYTDFSK